MPDLPDPTVTQDERTMATLAHALQIVGWWIAPLIIFLVKRDSRFVSFHAMQAFLLQVLYMIVGVCSMILWFVFIFATIARHGGDKGAPPPAFFLVMPVVWLGFMGAWIFVLVVAIVYAIKAGRGEWANYPLIGNLARGILKIDIAQATL